MLTKFPSYYVMSSNTEIGKTVFSTGISIAAVREELRLLYLKPVQTGFPLDTDSSFVKNYNPSDFIITKTIFSMSKPVSPHRAMPVDFNIDGNMDSYHFLDKKMITIIEEEIHLSKSQFVLIEGSGGAASPSLQGQLQCDVFRKFRLPVIFVADAKLGGISTSISTISLLEAKGFEVVCILLFEGKDENYIFLQKYYKNKFPVFLFKNIVDVQNLNFDSLMKRPLDFWYQENEEKFSEVFHHLMSYHVSKIEMINEQIELAKKNIWWPFTQHGNQGEAQFIDSAFEDDIYFVDIKNHQSKNILTERHYDATASWWTQGIGHASPRLTQAAAAAAGRYGHVMFPGNIHEPVVKLTEKLLNTVGKGWAHRVFFSDNGSTAVEVALKMAFRKAIGIKDNDNINSQKNIFILGLKDSYHGDTHAAMDATSENTFKKHEHWYNPRGYWLDYPAIYFKNKKYYVAMPDSFLDESLSDFFTIEVNSVYELFSEKRLETNLANIYINNIENHMKFIENAPFLIGALIIEPVIQGAGGMKFVDPLYQKILIRECKKRKIPIIFDEVFTGFWRLGKASASQLLDEKPDISCFAKLLTGGLLPLSVTLSGEEFFQAFNGDSLSSALLHGHSYSAHPVGCAVALEAIDETRVSKNFLKETNSLEINWNTEIINEISTLSNIANVICLGTLFAFELNDVDADYNSKRGYKIISEIKRLSIDVRPLGNVIYILSGFNTSSYILKSILEKILSILKKEQ